MANAKPKVAIVATGGTIASTGDHALDIVDYQGDIYAIERLLEEIPIADEVADILPVSHDTVGSDEIGPPEWLSLHRRIEHTAKQHPDLNGIVVTHGTATLEETAYFLNLTLKVTLPVVVVGAQRPITGLSTDGPMNLVGALRVAGSHAARELGVLVVMNDAIHAAREVTKQSIFRLDAFQSPDFGVLGHADLDGIVFYRHPVRQHTTQTEFEIADLETLPRVDVVASYAGADGTAVEAHIRAKTQGLVVAALAPGTTPPRQTGALNDAIVQGIVVVYASRAGSGRVLALSHQADDSVTADNLNPEKARVLLMVALTRTSDPKEVQRIFEQY